MKLKDKRLKDREIKFKFVLEHEGTKEKRLTRVYTFDDILNKFTDDIYEDFDNCTCQPVGETNVIECSCSEYSNKFLIVGKVMSTGLRDKNGKEIYEGDIVSVEEFSFNMMVFPYSISEIEFTNGYFAFTTTFGVNGIKTVMPISFGVGCLEVRGNIHENLELLEEKK